VIRQVAESDSGKMWTQGGWRRRGRRLTKAVAEDGVRPQRGVLMNKLADLIEKHADELAQLESLDMESRIMSRRRRTAAGLAATGIMRGGRTRLRARRFPESRGYFSYTKHEPVA